MLRRVGVVGGGCSGALAATHLLSRSPASAEIVVFESSARPLGQGIAYSTTDPGHLLNVCDTQMSAHGAEPTGFARWVANQGLPARDYQPRRVYGGYLADTVRRAAENSAPRLVQVRSRVTDLAQGAEGWRLTTHDSDVHRVDGVVLALGYTDSRLLPSLAAVRSSQRYVHDPWNTQRLSRIADTDHVLVIGSGLTAVDVALTLERRGHRGRITFASRHGILPSVHGEEPLPASSGSLLVEPGGSVRQASRALRRLAELMPAGSGPHAVVDAVRAETPPIWRSLPLDERRRFLRHAVRIWETQRHRMAPQVGRRIAAMLADGRLEVRRMRLVTVRGSGGKLDVSGHHIDARGRAVDTSLRVDHVINCTGPGTDVRSARDPLLDSILSSGVGAADPLGLGLLTDAEGRLMDPAGRVTATIRVVGPLRKGEAWESTAVPELRAQAESAADALMG